MLGGHSLAQKSCCPSQVMGASPSADALPRARRNSPCRRSGGYWRGSVWSPTNYMLLRGLTKEGFHDLTHEIARNHHAAVVRVFEATGTLWENHAPDTLEPGSTSAANFVGWTGLMPTAILFSVPNSSDTSLLVTRSAREMLRQFCHFPPVQNHPTNGSSGPSHVICRHLSL